MSGEGLAVCRTFCLASLKGISHTLLDYMYIVGIHTKRRIARALPACPSFGTATYFFFFQGDILNEDKKLVSCVDYFFIQDDGSRFKVILNLKSGFAFYPGKTYFSHDSGKNLFCPPWVSPGLRPPPGVHSDD